MGLSISELRRALEAEVDPSGIIDDAYAHVEEKQVAEELDKAPHGELWHTSFHVSSFPAGVRACGRAALYQLADFMVPDNSVDVHGRAIMDAGKDIEAQIVSRLGEVPGLLLSARADAPVQTNLVADEVWLSGSPDAVILPPTADDRPFLFEIKSKDHDRVLEMQKGLRAPDPWHVTQCKGYIGLLHLYHDRLAETVLPQLKGLQPCTEGAIVYVSRGRPATRHVFKQQYDPDFMREGFSNLASWRDSFLAGEIPERDPSWQWSVDPCDWCEWKKHVCKPDLREGITTLAESHGIELSKQVVSSYDYDERRERVLSRWGHADNDNGG